MSTATLCPNATGQALSPLASSRPTECQLGQMSVEQHLQMMDENGIDMSLLFISAPGVTFLDGEEAQPMAQQVNDIASSAYEAHPSRFRFLATLPLPNVNDAIAELSRASKLPGFAGVVMPSNTNGTYPGAQVWDAIM